MSNIFLTFAKGKASEHYHPWENGHPVKAGTGKNSPNIAYLLTPDMKKLLNQLKKYIPHV